MMTKLEQLEARIRELVEIRLVNILPGRKIENMVVQQLTEAIRSNVVETPSGKIAPNIFTLIVRPEESHLWQDVLVLETLKEAIQTIGQEAGLEFLIPPALAISLDESLAPGATRVIASNKMETLEPTNNILQADSAQQQEETAPENAFLIVEGRKVFPLTEPVINIGRRLENQLVIDDPRVSRTHAQIRAIKGRYVIFDLNSTGGTFVNGQRTSQSILYPGDVVSLAGITLVFGQDNPPSNVNLKETGPLNKQPGADRSTVILNTHPGIRKKKK